MGEWSMGGVELLCRRENEPTPLRGRISDGIFDAKGSVPSHPPSNLNGVIVKWIEFKAFHENAENLLL